VILLASSRPAPSSPKVGFGTGEAATKAMRLAKTMAFIPMVVVVIV
jgi:hypothetical protein